MNVERMLKLADAIENDEIARVRFDMRDFCNQDLLVGDDIPVADDEHDCGTACCIGGYAALLFGKKGQRVGENTGFVALGLDNYQAERLFYNEGHYVSQNCLVDITRAEAVAAIRRMAKEG